MHLPELPQRIPATVPSCRAKSEHACAQCEHLQRVRTARAAAHEAVRRVPVKAPEGGESGLQPEAPKRASRGYDS